MITSISTALLGGVAMGVVTCSAANAVFPASAISIFAGLFAAAVTPTAVLRSYIAANANQRAALAALSDEVWLVRQKSEKVFYLNEAARLRSGVQASAQTNSTLCDVLPEDQFECLRTLISNPTEVTDTILYTSDRFFRPSTTLLGDGNTVMLVLHDVTRELSEEKAKSDFISTVSHELRSPLTSIKGSMGLLLSNAAGELNKPARGLLEIAHRNAERLVYIINDILDLQKIVEGGMEFEIEQVDAAALIHEAIAASSLYMQRFDLKVDVVGADQPVELYSDPNRIIQVLGNLLTNAAKFSNPNGTITVALGQIGETVTIKVSDQGSGIPKSEQHKIFDRFADMSNSDRQRKGGSGLGLSICKAIIDNLQGTIDFESVEGVGTTFQITLPRGALDEGSSEFVETLRDAG